MYNVWNLSSRRAGPCNFTAPESGISRTYRWETGSSRHHWVPVKSPMMVACFFFQLLLNFCTFTTKLKRLALLGIVGAQLKALWNSPNITEVWYQVVHLRGPALGAHYDDMLEFLKQPMDIFSKLDLPHWIFGLLFLVIKITPYLFQVHLRNRNSILHLWISFIHNCGKEFYR